MNSSAWPIFFDTEAAQHGHGHFASLGWFDVLGEAAKVLAVGCMEWSFKALVSERGRRSTYNNIRPKQ